MRITEKIKVQLLTVLRLSTIPHMSWRQSLWTWGHSPDLMDCSFTDWHLHNHNCTLRYLSSLKYIYTYITYKSCMSTDNWLQFASTEFILAFSFSLFLTYPVTGKLILIYTILDCPGMHKSYFRAVNPNPCEEQITGEIQRLSSYFSLHSSSIQSRYRKPKSALFLSL